jgi:hypothetical protein
VANTLAYYDTATITAVKSFIVQAPEMLSGWYDGTSNDTCSNAKWSLALMSKAHPKNSSALEKEL